MTRCTTCNDTGKVTEPDERPVDAPSSWHGHRMEPVRVEVECEDCPRCDACYGRLVLVDRDDRITLRTDESFPVSIEVCDFDCLDRLFDTQPRVTQLIILGNMLHWWSLHWEHYERPEITRCFASRFITASTELMKELCE